MTKSRLVTSLTVAATIVFAFQGRLTAQLREHETVNNSATVIDEVMRTPGRDIPRNLLQKANAVVIIPNMIKGGFVVGVRHGRGVALIRNAHGVWDAPRFVQMTGGSVGFQAGVQSTDVVLLFMTDRSVQGMLSGKFTIGADAGAAAGPVGRQVSAATDERLSAEILSYARSRGLFAGASLDGSALRLDPNAEFAYYRATGDGQAAALPQSAANLMGKINQYSGVAVAPAQPATAQPRPDPQFAVPPPAPPALEGTQIPQQDPRDQKRDELAEAAIMLGEILPKDWQEYLAYPTQVFSHDKHAPVQPLQDLLGRFERIATNPQYRELAEKSEFQQTHQALRAYIRSLSANPAPQQKLVLPPVPPN